MIAPLIASILLVLGGASAQAALPLEEPVRIPGIPSQIRGEEESFEQAMERETGLRAPDRGSAVQLAVPLSQLDLSELPQWESDEQVWEGFERSRDERYLETSDRPGFKRRASWLYPDDGCFARAALTGQKLASWGYTRPKKLFIFGKLSVSTPNAPSGRVTWWYHVVPAVAIDGAPFVLDAAIDPKRPLPLEDWIASMTRDPATVKLTICSPTTYVPNSSCHFASPNGDGAAKNHQATYLRAEWQRLKNLRRNPELELGDSPPWLDKSDENPAPGPVAAALNP